MPAPLASWFGAHHSHHGSVIAGNGHRWLSVGISDFFSSLSSWQVLSSACTSSSEDIFFRPNSRHETWRSLTINKQVLQM